MFRKIWLLFALSIWMATPSLAQTHPDDFTNCMNLTAQTDPRVGSGGIICYDFTSTISPGFSTAFEVGATYATMSLDTNLLSGTEGTAEVSIQSCRVKEASQANNNNCDDTGLTMIADGAAHSFVAGIYRIEVTVAPTTTEDARVLIRGY